MSSNPEADTYAAVDLGSNSFHMLVARREHGELRVLDQIKEMVRLGGGLDENGNLDLDVQQKALDCLSRFGQRLRGIPANNIRAVGTQTFRRLKHADVFLLKAEQELECPIDIIAGREEARLIYLGVTQWIVGEKQKQLVIDIGGGSTELIIGEGFFPVERESLQFGCVSVTNRFFADGKITENRLKKAQQAVAAELQEIQSTYRKLGWHRAVGSSGTIRSAVSICEANNWGKKGLTPKTLEKLKQKALSFKSISSLEIDGLSERRRPVFIGGLAILLACFKALDLERMLVSPYALREGLLHDLLGRLEHRDPRDKAVTALMSRFAVDQAQVERVRKTALDIYDQIAPAKTTSNAQRRLLAWAAELHEIGLSLSHSSYHQHSAYLTEASDMAGFSRQEQIFLATMVGLQRRDIPEDYNARLPKRLRKALQTTLICIRLAWIFCRSREDEAIPAFRIRLDDSTIYLALQEQWMDTHPLTVADLEYEQQALAVTGLKLRVTYLDD